MGVIKMRFWFKGCRMYAYKQGKLWEVGLAGKHWWNDNERLSENKNLELAMTEAKLIMNTILKELK